MFLQVSGKAKEVYDHVARAMFITIFVPAAAVLLTGGIYWFLSGASPHDLPLVAGASAGTAVLSVMILLLLKRSVLKNLGGKVLDLATEKSASTPRDLRTVVMELRELIQLADKENESERQKMAEAMALISRQAQELASLLDAAYEKAAMLAGISPPDEKNKEEF